MPPGSRRVPAQMRKVASTAVELAGVSYSLVYKRVVTDGEVPGERDGSGVWTVARRDVKLLELQPKADDKRVATMVRVPRTATKRGSAPPATHR